MIPNKVIDVRPTLEHFDDMWAADDEATERLWNEACDVAVDVLAGKLVDGEEVSEITAVAALTITDVYGRRLPDTMTRTELASRLVSFTEVQVAAVGDPGRSGR
jgi:hypothetical protein